MLDILLYYYVRWINGLIINILKKEKKRWL